ncbi:replication restart helicase PriA [Desulfoluna spongiiphila]|uniref:replication restart helicase PriA n=1 Tax=Desulfoluna spongiiphila TaxID=419481 RepID=UPI001253677A|nr:primosomal protein N' [Desulfoluna spongiiphila]VVS94347.1 primosomal protein n' [Desulfoluna spongiiphila]
MPDATCYAQVTVTLPLSGPYTYLVPDHLRPHAAVGSRVLVPFGRRTVTGYITAFAPPSKKIRVKKIIDTLDPCPLFTPGMVPLFQWIADYYIAPMGDVIKTALPGGLNVVDRQVVSLTTSGTRAAADPACPETEKELLDILGNTPVPLKQLLDSEPPIPRSLIKVLENKGWVTVTRELSTARARAKMETVAEAASGPLPKKGVTEKRQLLLDFLRVHGPTARADLNRKLPSAKSTLGPMVEMGLIHLSEDRVERSPLGEEIVPDTPPSLTDEQQQVVSTVSAQLSSGYATFLLKGVTGSGKTEVYMRLVEDALAAGKTAVVLVPEIALIAQTDRRFKARFGDRIAVLHSGLSDGERYDQWVKIAEKRVSVVIGARSAIFAPLTDIGLIVVDEEHDGSYKQESGLRYNARDLAAVRARMEGAVVLLGSATPSIQSAWNARTGKFKEVLLTKRVNQKPMPEIEVVDLKKYKDLPGIHTFLTPRLVEAMTQTLDRDEQVLLFLNRRGFSGAPICAHCGEPLKCRHCDVSMTFHKGVNAFRCHICGYFEPAKTHCRICNGHKIKLLGSGTEKVEEAVKDIFPHKNVARMDQDTTARRGSLLKILKGVREKQVDIVVGTQMIAKGHDFPDITLVGVICADTALNLPDFRAGERTFQLLAQVAGRAGRGDKPGRVILQTYVPDHFTIGCAVDHDADAFYTQETSFRRALAYPPFTRIILVRIADKNSGRCRTAAQKLSGLLWERRPDQGIAIMGPAEAPLTRAMNRYRWQILLKGESPSAMKKMITDALAAFRKEGGFSGVSISIDVDPYALG